MSPYAKLKSEWINCQRCPLHLVRKRVVMVRGSIPADVVLVGEAPGESEDVLGQPFVGPAGKLLDKMVLAALSDSSIERDFGEGPAPTMCYMNLIGCIPKHYRKVVDADGYEKEVLDKVTPTPTEIAACAPRLDGLMSLCKPKLIIAVGDLSQKQAKAQKWEQLPYSKFPPKVIHVLHPAFILRQDISQQGLTIQKTIINLANAFSELY